MSQLALLPSSRSTEEKQRKSLIDFDGEQEKWHAVQQVKKSCGVTRHNKSTPAVSRNTKERNRPLMSPQDQEQMISS